MTSSNLRLVPTRTIDRRRFLAISATSIVAAGSAARWAPRSAAAQTTDSVVTSDNGTFLNPAIVHTLAVTFDQTDYEAMIDTYSSTGDKEWISASVTIDGTTYDEVGLRLKGNSSLMGLRSGGNGGGGMGGGMNSDVSADSPQSLPWLIRFDKNIDDQSHDGLFQLVIRSSNSETALNEAVALNLLTEAGLASQLAAYTAFSINGSEEVLRLAIENPKEPWMAAHFSADGLLYKSEAEGDWSYRGDDPTSYVDVFDLEAGDHGSDEENFTPLTSFLDFINTSDDETFAAELADRLDVDGFATYLAMMDLVANTDDIDGPGNNSYLYADPDTEQMTVVPWDLNLAFSGGFGGGGQMGGGQMGRQPGGTTVDGATPVAGTNGGTFPGGGQLPTTGGTPVAEADGSAFPEGGQMPTGDSTRGGGFGGQSNPLVTRFTANTDFSGLVTDATTTLQSELYAGGVAAEILARWVAVLEDGATAYVDSATITSESESIASFFTGS